jgi:hypothetical protein
MTEPIIFISRNRLKDGMLQDFRSHYQRSLQPTQAAKPGTLVQLAYVNEQSGDVDVIRVFRDAAALDLQLQGSDERSREAYRFIEPTAIEIYGTPNAYALEMMKKVAGSGIQVRITPQYLGGFLHPDASAPYPR